MTDTKGIPAVDTLFLIGTGVEIGGWEPVVAAIKEVYGAGTVNSPSDANFLFAQHVYELNLPSAFQQRGHADTAEVAQVQAQAKDKDRRLKVAIAKHLKQATASGKIKLRQRFKEALREPRFSGSRLFLTANWDLVLENEFPSKSKSIIHIHGDVAKPDHLFLPTEITPAGYRTEEEHAVMGKSVSWLWQLVAVAKRICIYGLSLSPLDAELAFTIGVGLRENRDLERHIILFAHKNDITVVEERIKLLSGGNPKIKIKCEPQG
jgi:hypothetical protein